MRRQLTVVRPRERAEEARGVGSGRVDGKVVTGFAPCRGSGHIGPSASAFATRVQVSAIQPNNTHVVIGSTRAGMRCKWLQIKLGGPAWASLDKAVDSRRLLGIEVVS